jgi:tetratricopeptide (TPR) repeat protein
LKSERRVLMRRILPLLSLALLASWGCFSKKTAVPTPPPSARAEPAPPAVTPTIARQPAPLESAPIDRTINSPSNLELGEMNFQVGNYSRAARAYEAFLRNNPKSKHRDQALFHLGLSRALADDNSRDLRRAEAVFKRLIAEFPDSLYRKEAEFILGLQSQIDKLRADAIEREQKIKKLSEELQVLKDIDLQRRPSRPKE